jgi:ATP-dependent exoDNAse (exonuclease V) beta subunit
LQDYLAHLETQRQDLELGRLLYVAVTRACHRLHLFAQLTPELMEDTRSPSGGSFLALLWPGMSAAFRAGVVDLRPDAEAVEETSWRPCVRRITRNWEMPVLRQTAMLHGGGDPASAEKDNIQFDWAGRSLRAIGIVVHRLLERIASDGGDGWDERRISDHHATIRSLLSEAGVPSGELETACKAAHTAISNILNDKRGRWILSADHLDSGSEVPLAGVIDGEMVHVVLDRTFVDCDGTRWIIDFKTGQHSGADLQDFMDHEQERYHTQLDTYARLMSALRPAQPVRVALYYPMHKEWREWAANGAN